MIMMPLTETKTHTKGYYGDDSYADKVIETFAKWLEERICQVQRYAKAKSRSDGTHPAVARVLKLLVPKYQRPTHDLLCECRNCTPSARRWILATNERTNYEITDHYFYLGHTERNRLLYLHDAHPMTKPEKLTLTNKLTGEVIDLEYSTLEEAEHAYLLVKSMTDTWERAQKRLVEYMGKQVEDKYQFADGATGQWVNPIRRRYRLEDVRKYLDEDQMAIVSEINGTKLKELLAQLVEDGHGLDGAWADIEANAESLPSKSYFKITKG